jgi:hypothetical protein
MYFEEGDPQVSVPWPLASAISLSVVGTLLLGVFPYLLPEMAQDIMLAIGR